MKSRIKVSDLIKDIYKTVKQLEEMYERPFTPDGHLIGSLGEVLVAEEFDLELLPPSFKAHDARDRQGKLVQIKATQRDKISLRSEPDRLIVIKILKDGNYDTIYDGSGKIVWENAGKMQSNGQRVIGLKKLKNFQDLSKPLNFL